MVLVDFTEPSCPSLCVSSLDFIYDCEEYIICTDIIITIPYESRKCQRLLSFEQPLFLERLQSDSQILQDVAFFLTSQTQTHQPFGLQLIQLFASESLNSCSRYLQPELSTEIILHKFFTVFASRKVSQNFSIMPQSIFRPFSSYKPIRNMELEFVFDHWDQLKSYLPHSLDVLKAILVH